MNYGVESFTGIRPTSDLTIANYIGAVQPVLADEAAGAETCVFLAELHAATTHRPAEVMQNSHELARTLIASGVSGDIYSQRQVQDLVAETEFALRGLTTVSRLLRLPTLKEKVVHSDDTGNASVGLAMYPVMMAADIVLARPQRVPTGKDQKPHLEITNELIRAANREFGTELPEPQMQEVDPPNILSLDASGRKMSKSIPKGAIFLNDTPEQGMRKIRKAVTASEPGTAMDTSIGNMLDITRGLTKDEAAIAEIADLGESIRGGDRRMGDFKGLVGEVVRQFLLDMNEKRDSVSDAEVIARVNTGTGRVREVAEETYAHLNAAYWRS
jgi:tryptophanyl-tRNA synthetase